MTDYVIQSSKNGGRTWKRVDDGVSAEPSATVTGLRNGRSYRFRVAAVTGHRTSPYSRVTVKVTPLPVDCSRPGPRRNLAGCDLEGVTQVDFSSSNLTRALLFGARPTRMAGAYLEGIASTTADFHGLDLRGSNLRKVGMGEVDLSGADLRGVSARGASMYLTALDRTDLRDADLTGMSFHSMILGTRFDRSLMAGCSFENSDQTGISGADFSGADLSGCQFYDAAIYRSGTGPGALTFGMRLGGADLTGTNFTSAKLRDLDLEGADLSTIVTDDAYTFGGNTGRPTALPPSWQLRDGFLVGPGVNLRGDASGVDFRGVDLSGANFGFPSIASVGTTQLTGADLSGADLSGVSGEGAVLDGAKLKGADLTGLSLIHSSLIGIRAPGADLTRAGLSESDLSGATFAGADLTDAGLSGDAVDGADLRTATLTGLRSERLTGVPLLPADWSLVDGTLVHQG